MPITQIMKRIQNAVINLISLKFACYIINKISFSIFGMEKDA